MNTNKNVRSLIGDFYKGNADRDHFKINEAVSELDDLLKSGGVNNSDFIEYYNDMYSGRTAYNTLLNVIDYPVESIIRELLQNAFDCNYDGSDIKVAVNFKDDYIISISYNETGFTLEQFMYYLSFGRNSGDLSHEGRFGIGAKSVFMNVEQLSMRSNNFAFKISNNHGLLSIEEINLKNPIFKGTEINIKVDSEMFRKIKDNLLTLTEKRGLYLNFIELCFAFNRKKIPGTFTSTECRERTFNIAVLENGKLSVVYKVHNHINSVAGIDVIRFTQNKKSVIDLICYENDGYVFLVPFAISNSRRRCLVKVLMEKYNFFSTYELTGLLKSANAKLPYEKFSAFFISVPNRCITPSRTGIRHDSEFEVSSKVEEGLLDFINKYKKFFILELLPYPNREGFYYLRPDSYAFEFVKNFILSNSLVKNIRNKFQNNISVLFPDEAESVSYGELKKNAYSAPLKTAPESFHADGSAYQKYIRSELDAMGNYLADVGVKTFYAAYEWTKEANEGVFSITGEAVDDDELEPCRVYTYEFFRGDKKYVIDSRINPALSDYNLYVHFSGLAERMLSDFFGISESRTLSDETVMEELFCLFDKLYGEEYKVSMRYSQFYFSHSEEIYTVDFSKMKINNIKTAMDCIDSRRYHFDTYQSYSDTVNVFMRFFTEGKDTVQFLRRIKEQGGEVTLQLDLNRKFRFSAYGNQFVIPSKITNAELLDIIGDVNILIKNGMLSGKSFDFKYYKSRYAFDRESVAEILGGGLPNEQYASALLAKIYVSDLKIDRIAILDGEDRIIDIVAEKNGISEEHRESAAKYVILRDDYTKSEFADIIECIITGKSAGKLSKFYTGAAESNQALPDHIPYLLKPLPFITGEEFKYLRTMVKKLEPYRSVKPYKNYFAKDVNPKLFGYSGICPMCGFKSNIINGFNLRDFKIGLFLGGQERYFKFSLYLCANDMSIANGWVIESLCIGGMTPFQWAEEIQQIGDISPEFLFCCLRYKEQLTYGATVDGMSDAVVSTASHSKEFILTPLLAAKWLEDNLFTE